MKKWLVGLLVGSILFSMTVSAYALTVKEAEEYIGETVLVISSRTTGATGMVISVDTYTRPGFGTETFLVILGFDKKLYVVPNLAVIKIQKVDMFGFPIKEKEEKPKIIE